MSFRGVDFYALDDLLTDEERLIRDTFRRFVDDELMPIVAKHFRAGTFPMELPKKLGALGALGASLTGYGCAGMGPIAYGLINQELERCDSGSKARIDSTSSSKNSRRSGASAPYGKKSTMSPRKLTSPGEETSGAGSSPVA